MTSHEAYARLFPVHGVLPPYDGLVRSLPLALEIGFGMGEATALMAAAEPTLDLIAVDVHPAGVASLLRRIEAGGLTNVRVIEGDAVGVLRALPEHVLSEVRVFFPDPWPKPRHAKRRLLRPTFAALVASRLTSDGRLHLATDQEHYVQHAREALTGWDVQEIPRPARRPETGYERRAIRDGRRTWDLLCLPPRGARPHGVGQDGFMTENPRQNTTFPSNGGTAHGYLALPEGGTGPGVIVIQEWWGLTDHIADVCDRLAREGFVALAPDLYGGKVAHDGDEAGKMMGALPEAQAAQDLAGAVDFLLAHDAVTSSKVGAVGFCMGGGFVLLLANQQGDKVGAAVPFYGVGPAAQQADFSGLTAVVQGHYGEKDDFYPVDQARAQEQKIRTESGAPVEFFYYDAGHAFHNDENPFGSYDAECAALAWSRTVEFLRSTLT